MKKQLLTVALLLSTNAALQASEILPGGRFISGAVRDYPSEGWGGPVERRFPVSGEPERREPVSGEPVRTESAHDIFLMELEKAGQVKLLNVLENRFNALSSDIKRIEDSRNKTKASATEIEAFQEKLTEQRDYSGLISTLQKKLTPQEYSNFLRENSQLIFHLIKGNNERITPPGYGGGGVVHHGGGYDPRGWGEYPDPIGIPRDQREPGELLNEVHQILEIVTELRDRK